MPHTLRVRRLQRIANTRNDGQRLRRSEPTGAHGLPEIHAVHVLHDEVEKAAAFSVLENGDDIRVVQFPQHPRLAGKSFGKRRIASKLGREDFQRDGAVERRLPRFIHKAHAALADELQHFQLRKCRAHFFERQRSAADWRELIRIAENAARTEPARRVGRDGCFATRTEFRVHTGS